MSFDEWFRENRKRLSRANSLTSKIIWDAAQQYAHESCAARLEEVANSAEFMPNMPRMVRLKASEVLLSESERMRHG